MEIKILCNCGTKLKFDWDPQRDGMPSRINCPDCNADVTLEAREIIRQQAAPAPLSSPAVPVAVLLQTPPPLVPGPPPVPPVRPVTAVPPALPRPVAVRAKNVDGEDSKRTKLIVVGVLLLVLAIGGYGVWKIGQKVYSTVETAREIATIMGDTSGINAEINLTAVDEVILYINHSNHLEVAQACTEFWQTTLNKNLAVVAESDEEEMGEGDGAVLPASNGYVRIIGALEWPTAQYEGLAKFLSSRFKTLVIETRDVDFTGAYHFGVYETGERKFHAQMDIVGADFDEKVTVENEAWALQHGFKPGEAGFQEFNMSDADEITKSLGMKLWDEPETDEPRPDLLLREKPSDAVR